MANRIMTSRGYMIAKKSLTVKETEVMKKALTVKPIAPPEYSAGISDFKVYFESETNWFLPQWWARSNIGEPERDIRSQGSPLREQLKFTGKPREIQLDALNAFRSSGHNGIISVPCGYGKTFMAIYLAREIGKKFIVVVHKEFLMDQWADEMSRLMPGIRIGKIQGEKCDIKDVDVSIAMIQTLCSRTYSSDTFDDFGFAVFDECHHLGAEHFSKALLQINTYKMLGLSATPNRSDGLRKVFEWFLGPIVFQIKKRAADPSVRVEVFHYFPDKPAREYANTPTNYRGDVIRARLLNQIGEYKPRTVALTDWIYGVVAENPVRKLLILSDRREHLIDFENEFKRRGFNDVGYYVGGMKQKDLDTSEKCRVILGTFAMASEGMNIPTLNMVLLATPKSNIEQSVGRILRQKPEERACVPIILDVVDDIHDCCGNQYRIRSKFYKQCGYGINHNRNGAPLEDVAAPGEVEELDSGDEVVDDKKKSDLPAYAFDD
jgi:superfamily II DNA or RNA helicase